MGEMVEFEFPSERLAEDFAECFEDVCTRSYRVVTFDEVPEEELLEEVMLKAQDYCGSWVAS